MYELAGEIAKLQQMIESSEQETQKLTVAAKEALTEAAGASLGPRALHPPFSLLADGSAGGVPGHRGHRAVREQAQLLLASVRGDRISVRHTGVQLAANLRRSFHTHGECVKVPTEGPSGGLLRDCEILANLRCEL